MRRDNDPAAQIIHKENPERMLLTSLVAGLIEEIGNFRNSFEDCGSNLYSI
jgi:hypothetical protein